MMEREEDEDEVLTWMSSVPPRMKTSLVSRWERTANSVVFHESST